MSAYDNGRYYDEYKEKLRRKIERGELNPDDLIHPKGEVKERFGPLERIVNWLLGKDLHAAERELILQEARRLKLKTDLQEARLEKARKSREAERLVASVTFHGFYRQRDPDTSLRANLSLLRTSTSRILRLDTVVEHKTNQRVETGTTFEYLKGTRFYREYLNPWVKGAISTEKLKALMEESGMEHGKIVFF